MEGIDYLRGIMSIFIVVGHMHGGGTSLIFSLEEFTMHRFTLSDFINFHLLLLAVPTFFLIAGYLFALKKRNLSYLWSYILKIVLLLLVWGSLLLTYLHVLLGYSIPWPSSSAAALVWFFSAGHTQYWFFVSLPLVMLVTALAMRLRGDRLLFLCTLSVGYLIAVPYIVKFSQDHYWLSAYWNPLNFISYPLCAVAIERYIDWVSERRLAVVSLLCSIAVLLSVVEWTYAVDVSFFLTQGSAMPFYTRGSLPFAVTGIFILMLHPAVSAGPLIQFFSRHSLSLYCLHPFLSIPVQGSIVQLLGPGIATPYVAIVIVLILCYIISVVYHAALKTLLLRPGTA